MLLEEIDGIFALGGHHVEDLPVWLLPSLADLQVSSAFLGSNLYEMVVLILETTIEAVTRPTHPGNNGKERTRNHHTVVL